MNRILLVGSSFIRNGQGVPDMNYTFRAFLSNAIPIDSLDIYKLSKEKFPKLNRVIARNLVILGVKSLIENKFIHILHLNDLFNTIPVINFSKYSNKKIITVHDFYPFFVKHNRDFRIIIDEFFKRKSFDFLTSFDHIFARTEEISKRLQTDYCISEDNITVQGPIIEHRYSQSEISRTKGGNIIIGYLNNFNWNKSEMLYKFIKIFKNFRSNDIEFHIYGSGFPYLTEIKDDSRIKYHGFLSEEEVPAAMARFDVYLSTSTYEGFGIPIAKAKAMKVPVLCYNGDIPNISKRHTCIWDEHNLNSLLESEGWKNVNLSAAFDDILSLRPENIVKQTIEVYHKVFS